MIINMTRQELIDRINEQIVIAQRYDAKQLKEHKAREQAALKLFREKIKQATKWTYEQVRDHGWSTGLSYQERPDRCPLSRTVVYEKALKMLDIDKRPKFRLTPGSDLYDLVSWDPDPPKPELC